MIMSKTKLNTLISFGVVGLALLTGASTALANDSDRISLLEKEVQALKLRLANLESPQSTPSNRQRVVATKDGWKSLPNWRSLKKGMNPDEVRSVLDEPVNVRASGPFTYWNYSNRGTVTFYEERLDGWTEPR
jgi:hypothetical protein